MCDKTKAIKSDEKLTRNTCTKQTKKAAINHTMTKSAASKCLNINALQIKKLVQSSGWIFIFFILMQLLNNKASLLNRKVSNLKYFWRHQRKDHAMVPKLKSFKSSSPCTLMEYFCKLSPPFTCGHKLQAYDKWKVVIVAKILQVTEYLWEFSQNFKSALQSAWRLFFFLQLLK